MAEELLKLQNIYKNFGNVKVLKDVNIKINKGEVVALIGDNGAGKSTLIKVITGVHSPNSGKVFFKEKEVQIKSVAQSRKMGIEAVYQERALCDQQELFRNIFAGREITNSFGFLDIKKQRKAIKNSNKRHLLQSLLLLLPSNPTYVGLVGAMGLVGAAQKT